MSENEKAERPSLENLISAWLKRYGHETMSTGKVPYPYMRVDLEDYPIALNDLLQTLLKHQFTREEVESRRTIQKIQEEMTPSVYDTEKLENWRSAIEYIWKFYINKEYADESLLAGPKSYPTKERKPLPTPRTDLEVVDDTYTPPPSKLDATFQGFGKSEAVYDDEFIQLLENLKNE